MTHLHEMDAPALLRWMGQTKNRDAYPGLLLDLIAVGLDRADWVTAHAKALQGPLGTVIHALAKTGTTLTEAEAEHAAFVGADAIAAAGDGWEKWVPVGEVFDGHADQWDNRGYGNMSRRDFLAACIRSGLTRTDVVLLIEAAAGVDTSGEKWDGDAKRLCRPWRFWQEGVSAAEVDAATFLELHEAGVKDGAEIAAYKAAEVIDVGEVTEMAERGLTGPLALIAHRLGLPREQWWPVVHGLNPAWLGFGRGRDEDPITDLDPRGERSALSHGWTLDDMRFLADHGWAGQSIHGYGNTLDTDRGRRSRKSWVITPDLARTLAGAGLTPKVAEAYASALWPSYRGSDPTPAMTDLAVGYSADETGRTPFWDGVIRLHAAGVKPSWISDLRWCGALTVDRMIEAADAGMKGADIKRLRFEHGKPRNHYSRNGTRLAFRDLMEAWTDEQDHALSI